MDDYCDIPSDWYKTVFKMLSRVWISINFIISNKIIFHLFGVLGFSCLNFIYIFEMNEKSRQSDKEYK